MDIQPVLNAYSCVMYLMKYFSKEQITVSKGMSEAIKQRESIKQTNAQTMRKISAAFFTSREMSHQGNCLRFISGLLLREFFRTVFLSTQAQLRNACGRLN